MPDGGTISLRTFQEGEEVILDVTDTGTGMSDEVLKRAMEPFFTTNEERGTGMGLAMVFGTLQRHNGTLEVESEVGKGTTFRFRLPVQTDAREITPMLEAEPFPAGLRFLVVDDEARVRDMVGEFLRRQGSTVETAANGREALEKFHQSEFDLVITDRGMPEMNGTGKFIYHPIDRFVTEAKTLSDFDELMSIKYLKASSENQAAAVVLSKLGIPTFPQCPPV